MVVGVVDKVSRPTFRSAGLLAAWVHLTGTFGTLADGSHGYPCLSSPDRHVGVAVETKSC
jgi:hypothetical protein